MPVNSPMNSRNRLAASRGSRADRAGAFTTPVTAALATIFNFLALNLVLLIALVPVITLPVAVNAATVALHRWRDEGEDSVVAEFVTALRSRPPLRTTILVGVPLVAAAVGVAEVRHFSRGDSVTDRVYLGLGLGALLITLMAMGYVFLLTARGPAWSPAELWTLCAGLAIRNFLVTGPLFLIEIAGATAISLFDPALLLLGVPLLLLQLMQRTAQFGVRRVEPK
ncbi:MAG: hypothetical protein ABSB76_01610 [Streptosporangiaceae bacterium]|jgi:hypothetical protein